MTQVWTHKATVWSAALLVNKETSFLFEESVAAFPKIAISEPKQVANATWSTWDNALPPMAWEYEITFRFEAETTDEAYRIALQEVDDLAARLSFFASAPVQVVSCGSVTNAPEIPEEGVEYDSLALGLTLAIEASELVIGEQQVKSLVNLLFGKERQQATLGRVERSMRWLQHSRLSANATDEYIGLMVAFENLAPLLGEPIKRYWRCNKCKQDIEACPECGESTEWKGSGNLAMEAFVCNVLHWQPERWSRAWTMRNKVLHGSRDLTVEDEAKIIDFLPDLEGAVINAIRHVINLPHKSMPHKLRQRAAIYHAHTAIKWKK